MSTSDDHADERPAKRAKVAEDDAAESSTQEPVKPAGTMSRKLWHGAREIAIVIVLALVISTVVRAFIGQVFIIPTGSMEDTIAIGDRVAAIKLGGVERGDIIVFRDPGGWLSSTHPDPGPGERVLQFIGVKPDTSANHLLKRVIGMPGDTVSCCDARGRLSINGKVVDESSYLKPGSQPAAVPFKVVVPADRLFVLGDNRDHSQDSRCHLARMTNDGQPQGMVAFVPMANVVGPAALRVAPLDRLGRLKRPAVFDSIPAATGSPPAKPVIEPAGVGC